MKYIIFSTLFILTIACAQGQCINWKNMNLVDSAELLEEGQKVFVKHMTNKIDNHDYGDEIDFYYYVDSKLKRLEFKQRQSNGGVCYTVFDGNLNKELDYSYKSIDSSKNVKYYKENKVIKEYNFSRKHLPELHYYMTQPYSDNFDIFFSLNHIKQDELVSDMVFDHTIINYDSMGNIINKSVQNDNYYEYIGDSILHYFEKGPIHYVKYRRNTFLFITDIGGLEAIYELSTRAYKVGGIEMKYYSNDGLLERHIIQDTIVKFKNIYGKKIYNVIYLLEKKYNKLGEISQILRYPLSYCIDVALYNNFNNVISGFYEEKEETFQTQLSSKYIFYSTSKSDLKKKKKILHEMKKYSYSKILIKDS